jgi:hypothetical protein
MQRDFIGESRLRATTLRNAAAHRWAYTPIRGSIPQPELAGAVVAKLQPKRLNTDLTARTVFSAGPVLFGNRLVPRRRLGRQPQTP